MNKLNDKTITKVTDVLDEAAMLYYHASINEEIDNTAVTNYNIEKGRLNYYECLLQIINYFLNIEQIENSNLDEETINKILNLFDDLDEYIKKHGLLNEEVRKALLLLDIKGFKNLNFSLDLITPDNVGYIICKIISSVITKPKITMLDFNVGCGNLVYTIKNNLDKEVDLIGIDNHVLMARIFASKANMLDEQVTVLHQDALEVLPQEVDVIVSDIATYDYENSGFTSTLYDEGIRYFPYLAIEHYLNIKSSCIYIYIIDNDFFSKKGCDKIKKVLEQKATIKAFIVLPPSMFQDSTKGKALLIIQNTQTETKNIPIYMLPSLKEEKAFLDTMKDIIQELTK